MFSIQVQKAIAECLPALVPSLEAEQAKDMAKKLLFLLQESESYGERRGAAYGLAGMVRGSTSCIFFFSYSLGTHLRYFLRLGNGFDA